MSYLEKVVTLTQSQYNTLAGGGTVGTQTGLDDDYIYLTTDPTTFNDISGTVNRNQLPDMDGATSSTNGQKGAVPAPQAGDQGKFLRGDGTWQPDHTYNFDGEQMFYSTSGNASVYSRDCDQLIANGHYWFSSNGPDASLGTEAPDGTGSLYVQNYSNIWVNQIAQDYRTGHLFVRSRNNGTWTAWKKVYDSDNKPTLAELNLPAVSASDNGKFMMVVNGAWAAVTVPAAEGVNF